MQDLQTKILPGYAARNLVVKFFFSSHIKSLSRCTWYTSASGNMCNERPNLGSCEPVPGNAKFIAYLRDEVINLPEKRLERVLQDYCGPHQGSQLR